MKRDSGVVLGIDTSCYTTSVAVVGSGRSGPRIIQDVRQTLTVKGGERGLRQSEAVFQHIKNLPQLLEQVLPRPDIRAVAVSACPRPVPGSYMPVFKVGESVGRSLALAGGIPCYTTSHQVGHIAAGLFGAGHFWQGEFLAFHVSGGTTELLSVRSGDEANLEIHRVGGSRDLHAGQFVDRVGVKIGLRFPAGPELERLAAQGRKAGIPPLPLPVAVRGGNVSFSGPEAAAGRALEAGEDPAGVAQGVEECIATSLWEMIRAAGKATGKKRVLLVGGVVCNQFIRRKIKDEAAAQDWECVFAPVELSSDNAVGIAAWGWQRVNALP